MKIAFFGTPELAATVLRELQAAGTLPDLIITNPDAKIGRKQILTPPPTALFAKDNNIELFQPESLKDPALLQPITETDWDLFIVVAYGKILPGWLLDIPKHGTINVHPSLLPKLRGASPIRSAILNDAKETGVTIMLLDELMDHGPILAQETTDLSDLEWPTDGIVLDQIMAEQGGQLLAATLPRFLNGEITPKEQDHDEATFCTKITKDMAEITLNPKELPKGAEAREILCKIRAFAGWPETFFIHENKRFKIKAAHIDNDTLMIDRIVPEGKNETDFYNYFK
jgi:methionyl-tRNA formyltransferase